MALTKLLRDNYQRRWSIWKPVDGDSIWALIDFGFGEFGVKELRLTGINTPEIHGVPDPEPGRAAARALQAWLTDHAAHIGTKSHTDAHFPYLLESRKDSEKYGRWLAVIVCGQGHILNQYLLDGGYAVSFMPQPGQW